MTAAVCACLFLSACSRSGQAPVEHLAIAPFENLTGDPGLDWAGTAIAEVIARQLSSAADLRPYTTGGTRSADTAGATRFLHGYLTRESGQLRARVSLEVLKGNRMLTHAEASGPGVESLIPMAATISAELRPDPRAFPAVGVQALKEFALGRSAPKLEDARSHFERAIELDPNFSAAYVALARLLLATQDRVAARTVIERGLRQLSSGDPLDVARLELYAATLAADQEAQKTALLKLTELVPAESGNLRRLAELAAAAGNDAEAATWYRRTLALEPENRALLNEAAYVVVRAGDLAEARRLLERSLELAPADPNPLDSLGDVHFYAGEFEKAESYYLQCSEKSPQFLNGRPLAKAAYSRLMRGDRNGGQQIFDRYQAVLARLSDPLSRLRAAQWRYATGDRAAAINQLDGAAQAGEGGINPAAATYEAAQLSLWLTAEGDRARAKRAAEAASASAGDLVSRRIALLARYLALDSGPVALWQQRADAAFPGEAQKSVRDLALSYALVMEGHFREAAQPLRNLLPTVPPAASEPVALLLAWVEIENRNFEAAGPLLKGNPVYQIAGEQIFSFLVFPRLFHLRERYFQATGDAAKAAEAARLYRLLTPEPAGSAAAKAGATLLNRPPDLRSPGRGLQLSQTRLLPPWSRSSTRSYMW